MVPLWSMPLGCEGGLQFNHNELTVINRLTSRENRRTTFAIADGRVLNQSDNLVEPESLPADTKAEISGDSLKPLRASLVESITPDGFYPVIVTDRFIFAKRSWFSFALPKFALHSQLLIVDRSSGSVVWHVDGEEIAIQASPAHIVVCSNERKRANAKIVAFLPVASRPQEIIDFYSAVDFGDVKKVAELFAAWKRTPLYDLNGHDPLTLAAMGGQTEVVKLLLTLNMSPNTESADGYSPLLAAFNWDHPEIAVLLLDAGADPNNNAREWDFPLSMAAQSGSGLQSNSC
jgi:Ankyrin repeats (3 copies)